MSPSTLRWAWALAAVFVLSVIAAVASRSDGDALRFIFICGLILIAPMSIFSALALSLAPSLRNVAAPTLISLNVAAIGSFIMAWRAPTGDEMFALILYIALSLAILVVSFAFAALLAPRRRL